MMTTNLQDLECSTLCPLNIKGIRNSGNVRNIKNYIYDYITKDDDNEQDIDNLISNETTYNINDYNKIINAKLKIKTSEDYFIKELEIFESNDKSQTLFDIIDKTKTLTGKSKLKELITSPITNIEQLEHRKNIITKIDTAENKQYIANKLQKFSPCYEFANVWFLKGLTLEMKNLIDMIYFNSFWNKWLNNNSQAMEFYFILIAVYPFISVFMPIAMMCVPLIFLNYMFGTPFSFKSIYKTVFGSTPQLKFISIMLCRSSNTFLKIIGYMMKYGILKLLYICITLFMYFCGIVNSYKIASSYNKILNMMHTKLYNIKKYITITIELNNKYGNLFGELPNKLPETLKYICDDVFDSMPSYFTRRGIMSKQFMLLKNNPDALLPYISYLSNIDMWNSVVELKREYNMTMPTYIYGCDRPILNLQEFYNIGIKSPVKNSIIFNGKTQNTQNIVITGANASGKSTTMKAIIFGVLLAQTICIVPATECELTPFAILNTYLNIPDCNGKASLYQAEMGRCNELINKIKTLDGFSLSIMDEIFVSTNYYEGLAGAYAVCKKIGEFRNSICIVSTHYPYLAKLCKKTKNYATYYFDTKCEICKTQENNTKDNNTIITNTYKMQSGINKIHIAIELMKKNNFDPDIIKNALKLYKYLIKKK